MKSISITQDEKKIDTASLHVVQDIFTAQMKYPQDVHFGSIWCPPHGYHIRAAEAMYPLAYYAIHNNNNEYTQSAIHLANWLSARQEPEGYWIDPVTEENTTVFQLLALACTFPFIKDSLGMLDTSGLTESMVKACAWCIKKVSIKKVSYAYGISFALALLFVAEELGNDAYVRKARSITRYIAKKVPFPGFSAQIHQHELVRYTCAVYTALVLNTSDTTIDTENACILPTVYRAYRQAWMYQYNQGEC